MINQYFSGFFQSFLRVNGTIGSNFQYQLFVVSLLFNTCLLYTSIIHHIEHQFAVFFRINNMVTVIIDKTQVDDPQS